MDTDEQLDQSMKLRVDWLPVSCLLLGLGIVIAFFNGWILVIDTHVVRTWVLSCALLVTSLVLWWLRSKRHPSGSSPGGQRSWIRSCFVVLLVGVVGAGTALGAFLDMGTESFILKPHGPDDCKVVVQESAFLMGGSGSAYAVNALGIGRQASMWNTDDGYRPIEAGDYTLEWNAFGGRLIVNGAFKVNGLNQKPINCN